MGKILLSGRIKLKSFFKKEEFKNGEFGGDEFEEEIFKLLQITFFF